MAATVTPSTWISSWAEDATTITVPIASFPALTATEADGTTGDIRKIALAVVDRLYRAQQALAIDNRPTRMVISKSEAVDATNDAVTVTYSLAFSCSTSSAGLFDVRDE
ncbi:MAG: hypothetical protein FJ189_03990 [Gammaproteobacteria bacterium]|nr:hypothetical protein [Gammaproteobacteria bacterium]